MPLRALELSSPPGQIRRAEDQRPLVLCILVASILLCQSITGGSLWIDEGFSAWLASHKSFGGLISSLRNADSADLQTPLYNAYLWSWARLFGRSEYALRAANAPFAILLCLALGIASWRLCGRMAAWVVLCLSPFVWVYMDEARAYLPMMACAAAATSSLLIYTFSPPRGRTEWERAWGPALCLLFVFAAAALDMLAVFVIPGLGAIVASAFGVRAKPQENVPFCTPRTLALKDTATWCSDWRRPLGVASPFFLVLGGYYVWTIQHGTDYLHYPRLSLGHIGYIGYEFLGFGGLGPGRNTLRLAGLGQAIELNWPPIFAGVVGLAAAFSLALLARRVDWRLLLMIASAFTASLAAVVACGLILDSRFLPRHAAALHPFVLFGFMALSGTQARTNQRRRYTILAIAALASVWTLSDFRIRLLPQYRKEDYRQAARTVSAMALTVGGDVAWAADPLTGGYYGLDLLDSRNPRLKGRFVISSQEALKRVSWTPRTRAIQVANWSPSAAQLYLGEHTVLGKPVILALSKPDIYDQQLGWARVIKNKNAKPDAQPAGFNIYILR